MSKAPAVSANFQFGSHNYELYKTSVSDTATSLAEFLNWTYFFSRSINRTYFFSRSINFAKTMLTRTRSISIRNKLHF